MEREKNRDAKLRIADFDKIRNNAIAQLRVLQGQRDRSIVNNDDISKDFQRKMGMVKALETEIYVAHDRIQKCIDEIERL
jgi:mannose/fructose/N-acetylgalactosamine-specific phosphotransferase system component IIB